jgi:hypothetical protein
LDVNDKNRSKKKEFKKQLQEMKKNLEDKKLIGLGEQK